MEYYVLISRHFFLMHGADKALICAQLASNHDGYEEYETSISNTTGLKPRTVDNCLSELKDLGFVDKGTTGWFVTSLYRDTCKGDAYILPKSLLGRQDIKAQHKIILSYLNSANAHGNDDIAFTLEINVNTVHSSIRRLAAQHCIKITNNGGGRGNLRHIDLISPTPPGDSGAPSQRPGPELCAVEEVFSPEEYDEARELFVDATSGNIDPQVLSAALKGIARVYRHRICPYLVSGAEITYSEFIHLTAFFHASCLERISKRVDDMRINGSAISNLEAYVMTALLQDAKSLCAY